MTLTVLNVLKSCISQKNKNVCITFICIPSLWRPLRHVLVFYPANETLDIKELWVKGAQILGDLILCGGADYFRPNYWIFLIDIQLCVPVHVNPTKSDG